MTDRIHIRDLAVECIIGINPNERAHKQLVIINLTLHTDLARAGRTDAIGDTVDYKTVKQAVLRMVEQSQFQLIERLAERIAEVVLSYPFEQVDVIVEKPGALRFARSVAVEISRGRKP